MTAVQGSGSDGRRGKGGAGWRAAVVLAVGCLVVATAGAAFAAPDRGDQVSRVAVVSAGCRGPNAEVVQAVGKPDYVYEAWIGCGGEGFARSTDGGLHFQKPMTLPDSSRSDDPALVIEVLNGYRIKEKLPENIGSFTIPLGIPEVLKTGKDATIVTYGAMVRIVLEATKRLAEVGIDAEVIDVQTLLPFDRSGVILESLKKTNRILFTDEDVPGGTTAYMLQEVIEKQGGYSWLDSQPRTLSSTAHRPAYGSDGDYFSKPNVETVFEAVYQIMHEADPQRYPAFF